LIRLIREEIPGTSILLTTPAETFKSVTVNKKRQYVRNENIAKAVEVISTYTEKENLACWDLYAISGGDNSCQKWFDAKLFGRDRIHFSRTGYEEQGLLLYKAIARSCILPIEN
jgi:lysophospholipase L1-like esterase